MEHDEKRYLSGLVLCLGQCLAFTKKCDEKTLLALLCPGLYFQAPFEGLLAVCVDNVCKEQAAPC